MVIVTSAKELGHGAAAIVHRNTIGPVPVAYVGFASIIKVSALVNQDNTLVQKGTVPTDSGAMIRDGIKSVASDGVCPEPEWPYVISKFATRPTAKCYRDAKLDRAVSYQSIVPNLNQMKGCLASGYPFIFGFTVYESFETEAVKRTGHAPMPGWAERAVGGHAVMAVGYDESKQWFLARNSWGTRWGMKGYFTMPYAYLVQPGLSQDFWTIRLVGK